MAKVYKNLPKAIKIGQRTFKIFVRNLEKDAGIHGNFAYTRTDYDQIILNDTMSIAMARSTLLHEVMHAIGVVYENGFAKVDTNETEYHKLHGQWEHYFINLYEESLTAVLRDNPSLVVFLTASDD